MLSTRRGSIATILSLLTLAAACERTTSPPPQGTGVTARLVSTHSDDGAALIELTGAVGSVSAPSGTAVYSEQVRDGVLRVLLVRETPGRIEFTLQLTDRAGTPVARVLDVANGADQPRTDVSTYRVEY